jgi:rubredoxin
MMKKKLTLLFLLLAGCLLLCSCQVNWFGTTAEVPWYVVAVPVALVMVAGYVILMNLTFVCPDCGTEFKPKKYELSVMVHFCGRRLVRCPKCGKRGYFERKRH